MKRKLMMAGTLILLNLTLVVTSCQKDNSTTNITGNEKSSALVLKDTINCNCIVNPSDTVTDAEIEMLNYMREEEKLARDVYTAMYAIYPMPIFNNISKSEQYHMDQVLCLLLYYNLPDPASTEPGVFNNPDLQELYDDLVDQGSQSLIDALTVGATIEDLDISDLDNSIAETSNEAIISIFERLTCGSGNHLRSFSAILTKKGVTYTPQYISQEEYDAIISSPHQYCGGNYSVVNSIDQSE